MNRSFHNFAQPSRRSVKNICSVITVDVSPSMEAADYPPTRLMAAISAVLDLLGIKMERFPDDHVGLVRFCGSAGIVQAPVRVGDHYEVLKRMALTGLTVGGSTNIAAGLKCASDALSQYCPVPDQGGGFLREFFFGANQGEAVGTHEVSQHLQGHIVLLTDGDHNCPGFPRNRANQLKESGVVIDCIGIGGSPAEVNEHLLMDIASLDEAGRPRYRFIADNDSLLAEFREMAKAGYLRKA